MLVTQSDAFVSVISYIIQFLIRYIMSMIMLRHDPIGKFIIVTVFRVVLTLRHIKYRKGI